MMNLYIRHDGWEVLTSSWTAAAKGDKNVTLCYVWSSLDGVSFFGAGGTGVAQVDLTCSMSEFLRQLSLRRLGESSPRPYVDLREFCL
jgi:hypothetical protein